MVQKVKGSVFNFSDQLAFYSGVDYGVVANGVTDDTAAVNTALTAVGVTGGVLVLPPRTTYTEASLVIPANVVTLDLARFRILHSSGTAGLEIKSQGKTGTYLQADQVDAATPTLAVKDATNNDLAIFILKTLMSQVDSGAHHTFKTAAGLERASLNLEALGAGSTGDLAVYLDANNDGVVEQLVAYFIRLGADALKLALIGGLIVGASSRKRIDAGGLDLTGNGDNWVDVKERVAPAAPAADTARLFVQDNGAGKTQLCAIFNTGAIQVIATQP